MREANHQPSPEALRLRALAHPLRWHLIDLLEREDGATATRCGEVLGASVASCSYHLGILGKYGYIEPIPVASGRERPWRLASRRQDLSSQRGDEFDHRAAAAAMEAFLDHEVARLKGRLRRVGTELDEWANASRAGGSTMYVTAAELQAVKDELMAILLRYQDRDADPGFRPPGAREARVFFSTSVEPSG